jgi:hypothetical protein
MTENKNRTRLLSAVAKHRKNRTILRGTQIASVGSEQQLSQTARIERGK